MTLRPGDLVGRLRTAALRIDHPHISEAHAYLSLRDAQLKLLSLRGGLALGGRLVREVTLAAGQEITLARGQVLRVGRVTTPDVALGLVVDGGEAALLTGRGWSITEAGPMPGLVPDAPVQLWPDGMGWSVQVGDDRARALRAGDRFVVGPAVVHVVELPTHAATPTAPTAAEGRLDPPLRIDGYFDAVHIHPAGGPSLVLSGTPARLICELAEIGQPVHWSEVGKVLWPDEGDLDRMRKRWDLMMIRLRKRLQAAAVRATLVHPDGTGNVRLLLHPTDTFVDHS